MRLEIPQKKVPIVLERDESPRENLTLNKLAALKTVYGSPTEGRQCAGSELGCLGNRTDEPEKGRSPRSQTSRRNRSLRMRSWNAKIHGLRTGGDDREDVFPKELHDR